MCEPITEGVHYKDLATIGRYIVYIWIALSISNSNFLSSDCSVNWRMYKCEIKFEDFLLIGIFELILKWLNTEYGRSNSCDRKGNLTFSGYGNTCRKTSINWKDDRLCTRRNDGQMKVKDSVVTYNIYTHYISAYSGYINDR